MWGKWKEELEFLSRSYVVILANIIIGTTGIQHKKVNKKVKYYEQHSDRMYITIKEKQMLTTTTSLVEVKLERIYKEFEEHIYCPQWRWKSDMIIKFPTKIWK